MTNQNQRDGQKPGQQEKASPSSHAAKSRQKAIGRKLRHIFDDVVNEPVPDEFVDLLRKLGDKEKGA